jgi:hypothetical protein
MRTHPLARTLAVLGLLSLACGLFTPATQAPTPLPTTPPAAPTPAAGAAPLPLRFRDLRLPVFAAYDEPVVNLSPAVAHEPIAADLS